MTSGARAVVSDGVAAVATNRPTAAMVAEKVTDEYATGPVKKKVVGKPAAARRTASAARPRAPDSRCCVSDFAEA
jgi:hypothetical protein